MSIREALVLWAVLILAVLRWSKPAVHDVHATPHTQTASNLVDISSRR